MAGALLKEALNLPSGGLMPVIGFGTFRIRTNVEDIIRKAVQIGYRHIDTAYTYKNETEIGSALAKIFQDGVIKRKDLFIVTKLPGHAHYRAKVKPVLQGCLERLQLNYVDLFLIHTPLSIIKDLDSGEPVYPTDKEADLVDTWKGMEDVCNEGLTKAIGLSNFNSHQITRILKNCSIKPENLQVECHAYFQQKELHKFCQQHGITFTAYSPLGRPGLIDKEKNAVLMEDETVKSVALKYGKTPAQIVLRFLLQFGMVVIPKSANEGRMKENFQVFDFMLNDDDMDAIREIDKGLRYVWFDSVPGQTDHPQYPFKAAF